jgi:hypothetical protein
MWKLMGAVALVGTGLALASPVMADTGTSPAEPGGMYLTLFGGYVNSDGPETTGHFTIPFPPPGPNPHVSVGAEEGGFVGGSAGYVLGGAPLFGLQNMRVEASISALILEDDKITAAPASASILDLDVDFPIGNQTAVSRHSRDVYDYAIALKGDVLFDGGLASAFGVEVFLRRSADNTSVTSLNSTLLRSHEVNALFYGVMAVLQPEFAVTPMMSVVADLGAGMYGVNADADSATNLNAPLTFNDTGGAFGFRGRALGGLRFHVFEALAVTAFGGVDYWSDVPFADQSSVALSGQLPTVAFGELVELKAGLMLTWALGGAPN